MGLAVEIWVLIGILLTLLVLLGASLLASVFVEILSGK